MSGSHSQEGNYENTDGSDIHTLLDYSTRILFLVFMRGDVPPSTLQGEFEGVLCLEGLVNDALHANLCYFLP